MHRLYTSKDERLGVNIENLLACASVEVSLVHMLNNRVKVIVDSENLISRHICCLKIAIDINCNQVNMCARESFKYIL